MSKTNIVQKVLALCVVGAFAALGASCGSEADCSSDQAFYEGQCVVTCDSAEDCEEGQSCVGASEINGKVCVGGDTTPDGGMDGGVDDGGDDDDGGNGDDGPDYTGRSCSGLNSCLGNCPDGDTECRNNCSSETGIIGSNKFNGLIQCIDENNCDSQACYYENCADEYYACFPDQSPGQKNCATNFRCAFQIQTNEACQENMTNQARIDYANMLNCAESNGCTEVVDGTTTLNVACMVASCQPEVNTCGLQDTGNLSCSEGSACSRANSGSDQIQCLLDFSSAEEAGEYTAYQDCVDQNCESAADVTLCADANCSSERDACGLAGSQSNCSQSWDCFQGNIEECSTADNPIEVLFNNYVYEGTAQAQSDFYSLFNCVTESSCGDLACLENECGSEADACGVTFSN